MWDRFAEARAAVVCILFIDEIDRFGGLPAESLTQKFWPRLRAV
jgi:ATP-dependent 26S proteasome regulatory subunit